MSQHEPRPDPADSLGEEQEIAGLLRRAGSRPDLPEDDLLRIADAARSAWRFQVHRRRRHRRVAAVSGIAALLAVAVTVLLWTTESAAPLAAAEIEALAGPTLLLEEAGTGTPLAIGDSIVSGARLATSPDDGSASLRLVPSGTILRLDRDTQLRLASATLLELERGALYVDSGTAPGDSDGLAVATRFGVARDIGTQFSVRLLDGAQAGVRVRVRSGEVRVERADRVHLTHAGEELLVHEGGDIARRAFAPDDPDWSWAMAAAPPYRIDGKTLGAVLRWACREAGWRLEFADPALESEVESVLVRGGIGDLRADQAPFAVLPGAGLAADLDAGVLTVRRPD